jgi:hypothetical protein
MEHEPVPIEDDFPRGRPFSPVTEQVSASTDDLSRM